MTGWLLLVWARSRDACRYPRVMTGYNPCDDKLFEWIPGDDIPGWLVTAVHQGDPVWTACHGDARKIAVDVTDYCWVTGGVAVFCLEFVKNPDGRTVLSRGRRLRPGEVC